MSDSEENIVTRPIGVKQVSPAELFPNPHNPRLLFDKVPMDVLKSSIQRVGILVPLTVYREEKKKRYVILDGQRRWICAQEVGLKAIPVNVVHEPTLVQNIVTMFQIHKLREDWELMPTALKLELLMKSVPEKNDARLAELTGLNEAVIVRCKKLISYDRKFQNMMLHQDPNNRVKADFFIELYSVIHDRDVKSFPWFRTNRFVEQMLGKYLIEPTTIKAVTDFRRIKQHITNARRIKALSQFSKRLQQFAEIHETPIDILEMDEAQIHAEARALTKKVSALKDAIRALDVDQFYGEEELWAAMEELARSLEKKLKEADKRR